MGRKPHPFPWIVEPLLDHPEYLDRAMFGCRASYLNGVLVLVCSDQAEPWNGILVPVEKDRQRQVIQSFPVLSPHPILGKWLYLSQSHSEFESIATQIVECLLAGDPRFGTVPHLKKRKQRSNSE